MLTLLTLYLLAEPGTGLFADGFETGNTSAWSVSVGVAVVLESCEVYPATWRLPDCPGATADPCGPQCWPTVPSRAACIYECVDAPTGTCRELVVRPTFWPEHVGAWPPRWCSAMHRTRCPDACA